MRISHSMTSKVDSGLITPNCPTFNSSNISQGLAFIPALPGDELHAYQVGDFALAQAYAPALEKLSSSWASGDMRKPSA